MRSLRARLLWGMISVQVVVLSLAGFFLLTFIRRVLYAEFDAALLREAEALSALVEEHDGRLMTEFAEHDVSLLTGHQPIYQLRDSGGIVVETSSGWLDDRHSEMAHGFPRPGANRAEFRFVHLTPATPGRSVTLAFVPHRDDEPAQQNAGSPERAYLTLGQQTTSLDRSLGLIQIALAAIFGAAVLGSAAVTLPLIRLGLRPLNQTSRQIEAIESESLGVRLSVAEAPTEIRSVIRRINDLLERLEVSFTRERAFSANVAHELRTPIAGLQVTLDVAASRSRSVEEYQKTLAVCQDICHPLQTLIETLLLLARSTATGSSDRHDVVDLPQLLMSAWQVVENGADQRNLSIRRDVQTLPPLVTDRCQLELVLSNLLGNAVQYCDHGGTISMISSFVGTGCRVTISNTGSQIPADQAAHVFERFWRGDQARVGTGTHVGLGLPLCQALAERLGGSLVVTSELGGTFTATLELPTASADSSSRYLAGGNTSVAAETLSVSRSRPS